MEFDNQDLAGWPCAHRQQQHGCVHLHNSNARQYISSTNHLLVWYDHNAVPIQLDKAFFQRALC